MPTEAKAEGLGFYFSGYTQNTTQNTTSPDV